MFKVLGVAHIAIAAKHSKELADSFRDLFGLEAQDRELVESQKVSTEFLKIGQTPFELLEPTASDSPISKFLEKRGNAFHHLAIRVDDIHAALDFMKKKGVQLIDETPRKGAHNTLTAFLHPKAFHGILLELVQE